jgi:hypothetical protein
MIIVRATQKLINTQRIKPEIIDLKSENISVLSEWYANTITSSFKGKSFVIYVHYPSLITVIVMGKTINKTFSEFKERLNNLLARFSFPQSFLNEELLHFNNCKITKTNSRKMLGFMNSITDQIISRMYTYESISEIDFDEEENILMNYIHGNKPANYFTPSLYWGNYFIGEDPTGNYENLKSNNSIKLIPDVNKLSRTESLHMENQLMKIQIEDILGGQIMNGSDNEIPTEIENIFLKNIIEFEKLAKESKKISVFELLGKPKFKETEKLNPAQLKEELNKALTLLNKKSIHLDFLAEYSNEVMYHFITKELIAIETQTLNFPGMIIHFIYEDFHPNVEFEVLTRAKQFIHSLLIPEESKEILNNICGKKIKLNGEIITIDELLNKFNLFLLINNVESFRNYKKTSLLYNETKSKIKLEGNIEKKEEGAKVKKKIPMHFYLVKNQNNWQIAGVDFELLS